MKVNAVNP